MKVKAIATCRVSTPEQLNNGSMDRQDKNVHDAATVLTAEIVKVWSGSQSSKAGVNVNRPDLQEMVAFCTKNKDIKYLIVDEVDRFMRSLREMFYFEITFERLGVTVWYASQPDLNKKDHHSTLLRAFEGYKAEGSNVERQMKSSSGLKSAASEGRYPTRPLQGYRKSLLPGVFDPDPIRFPVLQMAFKEVAQGLYTPSQALRKLNATGYRTPSDINNPTGKPLRIDHFKKMLINPYYAGLIRIGIKQFDWVSESVGQHTSMINMDEHSALVSILSGGAKSRQKRKQNPHFPLSALALCVDCDRKLTGFMHVNGKPNDKGRPKYRCTKCNKQHHRDILHESIQVLLDRLCITDEYKQSLLVDIEATHKANQKNIIEQIQLIKRRRDTSIAQKAETVKAYVSASKEMKTDLAEQVTSLKRQIENFDREIAEINNLDSDLISFAKYAIEYTQKLSKNWLHLDHEDKKRCFDLLFPKGIYANNDSKVYTPAISPLFRYATNKKEPVFTTDSLLVELRGIAPRSESLQVTLLQT